MGDASLLLKLLEPAVRPGGLPGGATPKPANEPVESRSFDSLLDDARLTMNTADSEDGTPSTDATVGKDAKTNPVSPLSGIDRIENADLRTMIAGCRLPNAK